MFKNREEAAIHLAVKLLPYKGENTVVVALPRGGLPIARVVANALKAPLDIFFVKKIPSPFNKEAAIGAVSESGHYFVDENLKRVLRVSNSYIKQQVSDILKKIKKQRELYKKERISYKDKRVILIDDGVATGSSMLLAIEAVKKEGAKEVIVAAPVAPIDIAIKLQEIADYAIFLETPINFRAVGEYYNDFHQLSDREVVNILKK